MEPLLKIVLVQTHSELSETDNLWDESELIACKVCVGRKSLSYQEAIGDFFCFEVDVVKLDKI